MLSTTFTVLLLSLAACASNVNLYHRVFIPGASQSSFIERGVLDTSSSLFQPSPSLSQHLSQFADSLQDSSLVDDVELDHILYQVALERERGEWDVSSVKLCHLPFITSELIILHVSEPSAVLHPYAVDYFVSPITHDGSCPKFITKESSASLLSAFSKNLDKLNTTVSLTSAALPPLPQLRTPPPLTPTGQPVQPVPEKSFLQKYWMYIAAVAVALLMSGGAPEEGQQPARK
ncbi:hypothetical protein D9758_008825 [Tetrapyrgos nigripes]|uniref:ER membrane protein complex subunit 10 n=1 Tax=Tetrapyrgos nigripes TaxID=182062 RepID=A0A8H5CLQ9_9AGAR|nr:hypothetical protein D9758_008825 [Tetrapyrgos nigripes]